MSIARTFALGALAVWAPLAKAVPVLDQSQTTVDQISPAVGTVWEYQAAQSFRVGLTGTLVQLDLFFSNVSSGAVIVELRPSIPFATSPALQSTTSDPVWGWNSFAFDLPVTAGDELAMVVRMASTGEAALGGGSNDQYFDGNRSLYAPFWGEWLTDPPGLRTDLAFRTYVDPDVTVPEPGTAALLLAALSVLAVARPSRRSRASQPHAFRLVP